MFKPHAWFKDQRIETVFNKTQVDAVRLINMEAVIRSARLLREAQVEYMDDRGNEEKGKLVASRAASLDMDLYALDTDGI